MADHTLPRRATRELNRESKVDAGDPESGRFELAARRHHLDARPQSVELVDAAAFDDAAAERDAFVVVAAVELEPEQAVDERGRVAAVEAVPPQALRRSARATSSSVRRAPRPPRRCSPRSPTRTVAAIRAGAPGVGDCIAPSSTFGSPSWVSPAIDDGSSEVDVAELLLQRVGLHLVRADVVGREALELVAHPRHRSLRAVHDLAQRQRVAELVGRKGPLLAERFDVAHEEPLGRRAVQRQREVVLAEGVVRELADHRARPHAEQQRQQALHQERADVAAHLRREIRLREPQRRRSTVPTSASPERWSAPASAVSTGTSPSSVAWAQPDRSTHTLGTPSVPAMPVVSATVSCAARTTSSKVLRVAASIAGSVARLAGLGIGGRDRGRDLLRDLEVDRSLRLQHAHELIEIEAERVREARARAGRRSSRSRSGSAARDLARCLAFPVVPLGREVAQAGPSCTP